MPRSLHPSCSLVLTPFVLFAVLLMHGTGSTARAQSECAEIHLVTEKAPEVQGGLEALQASARYPENARTAGVEGRVFVQFIVNTRGHATSPVVTRSVRADLDAEAVRVIRTARFTPGQQGGRAVCVQMSLPITFRPGMESASPVSSAPGVVTDATASVENTVSSVTNQVDETTDSVNSAASSVTQGVEDTNASISSTTREVSDAAASLKKTVGGLFGKKREADATSESGGLSTQSGSSSGSEMVGLADGDIVHAKVDNLELLTRPLGDAPTVTQVLTSDQLVYMGKEVNDFIFVQTSKGQGWINKLLVTKQ